MRDEFLDPFINSEREVSDEVGLRPRHLDDFVGQRELKEHLDIVLGAAKQRGQAADHILLAGPPGLGKTTLAGIVAAEMNVAMHVTSGPALERAGDLASILTKLGEGDVLFIYEIHRLSRAVEEILYPAMEDFQIDIVVGQGASCVIHQTHIASVHSHWCHDAHRNDYRSTARQIRFGSTTRLLRRRGTRFHCDACCRNS